MTNEKAIEKLTYARQNADEELDPDWCAALDVAIEALEERMRTHASDSSEHETHEERTTKVGHWIEHEWAQELDGEGYLISNFECDKCHAWAGADYDYCPNCGVKMEVENDRES